MWIDIRNKSEHSTGYIPTRCLDISSSGVIIPIGDNVHQY